MKQFYVGVRNNKKHNWSIVGRTNYKWIAKLISIFYKPFVNEVEITAAENIIVNVKHSPFIDTYVYKSKNQYFYIWRGWWQQVGPLIYDTWDGEKQITDYPIDDIDLFIN